MSLLVIALFADIEEVCIQQAYDSLSRGVRGAGQTGAYCLDNLLFLIETMLWTSDRHTI